MSFFYWLIIPLVLPLRSPCSHCIGNEGSGSAIGRKRNTSDPSNSDSVELPIPLPILRFDFRLDRNRQTDRQTYNLYLSTMVEKAMQLIGCCVNTKPINKIYA